MLSREPYPVDEIDSRLLHELQVDAKISLGALGERVGLTAPAVMERVRKLEQAGVICGYHAQLDGRRLGLDITAFVGVSVRDPALVSALERWAAGIASILECHHVTGGFTLLLKAKVSNTGALEALIHTLRSRDGVTGTETMVVFSTSVERSTIPVEADEPATSSRRRVRRRKTAE